MKRYLTLFLLASVAAVAQSLPSVPGDTTAADTTHANVLLSLGKKAKWVDSYRSLGYADQALAMSQSIAHKKGIAAAHALKGFCYWTFGDNDQAIQEAMASLEIAEQIGNTELQAESYYILARGYMDVRENGKAHEAIRQAERLADKHKNYEQLCSIYNLKGVIYFIDNKFDSALSLYNKAFEIGKSYGIDPINFPRIISNIGECYAVENPSLALTYYNQALSLAKETGNKIAEASITAIIGHAFLQRKEYTTSEKHLQTALALAQTLGLRRVIRHAYGGLVDIKLQQGRGDEAVVYLRKYYAVRDSLLSAAKIRQIVELEAKHELQLKEQSIKLLESEQKNQRLLNSVLTGVVGLLLLIFVAVYQWQRYRYRKNRELLDLEIDYLTQQNREAADRYKTIEVSASDIPLESYDQKLLRKVIHIVESNISDPALSVEKLAGEMSMSRASLHRKIKSITGFTTSELIRSIRLRKAARLLAAKTDSASQIALRVGFDDYAHFSKAFKKYFGVAPTAYQVPVLAE